MRSREPSKNRSADGLDTALATPSPFFCRKILKRTNIAVTVELRGTVRIAENWKEMLRQHAADGMNRIVTRDASSEQARKRGPRLDRLPGSKLVLDAGMNRSMRWQILTVTTRNTVEIFDEIDALKL